MDAHHISLAELVAYRTAASDGRHGNVREHLESGCSACRDRLRLLDRLIDTTVPGTNKARSSVPASGLGISPLFRLSVPIRTAPLVFDSLLRSFAGTRGGMRAERQLVYSADEWMLHVNIEPEYESGLQSITGQVMGVPAGRDQFGSLPVLLVNNGQVVRNTCTDKFGEFSFRHTPPEELAVCVVRSGQILRVVCPAPFFESEELGASGKGPAE